MVRPHWVCESHVLIANELVMTWALALAALAAVEAGQQPPPPAGYCRNEIDCPKWLCPGILCPSFCHGHGHTVGELSKCCIVSGDFLA